MSLEVAIRENTAALQALTAALSIGAARPQPVDKPASVDTGSNDKHEPAVAQAKPALDYEKDVKPAVLRLAAKDKAALRAILDECGVAKGSEVEPQNLAAFNAALQARLRARCTLHCPHRPRAGGFRALAASLFRRQATAPRRRPPRVR